MKAMLKLMLLVSVLVVTMASGNTRSFIILGVGQCFVADVKYQGELVGRVEVEIERFPYVVDPNEIQYNFVDGRFDIHFPAVGMYVIRIKSNCGQKQLFFTVIENSPGGVTIWSDINLE